MILFWQPEIKLSHKVASPITTCFFIFVSIVFFNSCKNDESVIGVNLRPDQGEFFNSESDSFSVIAYTIREDSLKTDSLSTNILGTLNDPMFGLSTASIATELTLTDADISFGTQPRVDSAILYVRWDKAYTYGEFNATQNINLYYLEESILAESRYFSNHQAKIGKEIGKWTGKFNLTDSVSLKEGKITSKKAPGLKIKLYNSTGEDFANADPAVYNTVETFKEFVKGIVIVPGKSGLSSGQGGISGIDFFSGASQLIVYYNDSLTRQFKINNNCQNYNLYDHKNIAPAIEEQFNKPGKQYSTTFVQSMAGCKTKIEIPHLLNIASNLDNERIIVNEAALILTPQNGSISTFYTLPSILYLFQPDQTTGQNSVIIDFVDYISPNSNNVSKYGGGYNTLTGNYTIRFTRHLQNLLDHYLTTGENLNRGFYVTIPSDKPITPTRLVLDNRRDGAYKNLKVRITYSKIKI